MESPLVVWPQSVDDHHDHHQSSSTSGPDESGYDNSHPRMIIPAEKKLSEPATLDQLPLHVLSMIVSKLGAAKDVLRFEQVCTTARYISDCILPSMSFTCPWATFTSTVQGKGCMLTPCTQPSGQGSRAVRRWSMEGDVLEQVSRNQAHEPQEHMAHMEGVLQVRPPMLCARPT